MPDRKDPKPEPTGVREAKKRWPKKRQQQELALFWWCANAEPPPVEV